MCFVEPLPAMPSVVYSPASHFATYDFLTIESAGVKPLDNVLTSVLYCFQRRIASDKGKSIVRIDAQSHGLSCEARGRPGCRLSELNTTSARN